MQLKIIILHIWNFLLEKKLLISRLILFSKEKTLMVEILREKINWLCWSDSEYFCSCWTETMHFIMSQLKKKRIIKSMVQLHCSVSKWPVRCCQLCLWTGSIGRAFWRARAEMMHTNITLSCTMLNKECKKAWEKAGQGTFN